MLNQDSLLWQGQSSSSENLTPWWMGCMYVGMNGGESITGGESHQLFGFQDSNELTESAEVPPLIKN